MIAHFTNRFVSLQRAAVLRMVVASVALLAGCSSDTDSRDTNPHNESAAKLLKSLELGDEVTVVRVEGEFAAVQSADGREGFVATEHLQRLEGIGNSQFVAVEQTQAYASPPNQPYESLAEDQPRSLSVLRRTYNALDATYVTDQGYEIVNGSPEKKGHLRFDPQSGEICWPAKICLHPNCPHLKETGERMIFPWPDPLFARKPNGSYGYATLPSGMSPGDFVLETFGTFAPLCPACLEVRDRSNETARQRARYDALVRPYYAPDLAAQRRELEREMKAASAAAKRK